ncbi:MAG: hypothetical protein SGPRY_012711 [Prymnesium sp.]
MVSMQAWSAGLKRSAQPGRHVRRVGAQHARSHAHEGGHQAGTGDSLHMRGRRHVAVAVSLEGCDSLSTKEGAAGLMKSSNRAFAARVKACCRAGSLVMTHLESNGSFSASTSSNASATRMKPSKACHINPPCSLAQKLPVRRELGGARRGHLVNRSQGGEQPFGPRSHRAKLACSNGEPFQIASRSTLVPSPPQQRALRLQ